MTTSISRTILATTGALIVVGILMAAPAAMAATTPAIPPAPTVEHPVVDETGTLSKSDLAAIDAAAAAGHAKNGQETAVLLTSTLHGEAIEDYSIKVSRAWGIGQKGTDNGVLIIVALNDHKLRIEVGKGLEGDLPDITTGHIINDQMIPLIKNGDIAGALLDGVKAVQVGVAKPPVKTESTDPGGADAAILVGLLAVAILALLGMIFFLSGGGSRRKQATADAAMTSTPYRSAVLLAGLAAAETARLQGSGSSTSSTSRSSSSSSRRRDDDSYSGGGYSGSSSSGGFDSGSSFGGGGFDGGGSSGSW